MLNFDLDIGPEPVNRGWLWALAIGVSILVLALTLAARPAEAGNHRSAVERRLFVMEHPCPSTGRASGPCPGWVVDHIVPLCKSGADMPFNMQWQEKAASKAKDKWECR